MGQKQFPPIFVIGFLGSHRVETARSLAEKLDYEFINIDKKIEKEDGRTILRICMSMGEHEYRNKEFEALQKLINQEKIVVACGDGIIFDEMNVDILKNNQVIVADKNLTVEELWQQAMEQDESPYAFMQLSTLSEQKEKFYDLYQTRISLYNQFID
ncbi:MAG: shikimate kinase [Anaerovoracaceae bacterium]